MPMKLTSPVPLPAGSPRPSVGADTAFDPAAGFALRHAALFAVSSLLTITALYFSVSGADIVGPASIWIAAILGVNILAIGYLGLAVGRRVRRLVRAGQEAEQGARLHLRFVGLFALAAVVPAIVIATFSAVTFGQGVQAWLSSQVRGGFEATRVLGRQSIDTASDTARADIVAMASDLNAAGPNLARAPEAFQTYLETQAARRGFVAAYIIDSRGVIIKQATRPSGVPGFVAPRDSAYAAALAGDVAVEIDENVVIRALFRLGDIPDGYLLAVRLPEEGQPELLRQAEGAVRAFRSIEERNGWLQGLVGIAYLETVILVLIGAAWLGLASATRISAPIGSLAVAAERIRAGDLSARVDAGSEADEIAALAGTFNRMAGELESQRATIESARETAETRSAFIRAVLEGVAAGVLSLDGQGLVTAANASAARLLGLETSALEGLRLSDVAPEFADVVARVKPSSPASAQVERLSGADTLVLDVRAAYAGEEVVVTIDDVSGILAAQRQAAWRDVARRIAHEIKNPLTPIQLSAERLRRKYANQVTGDQDAFIRMTDTIVRQVGDIGRMVDEFSAFARMPAPRFVADDLAETLRQAVFAQRIASPDIDVSADTPPEPTLVSMDTRLIAQALANLLKNAAEAVSSHNAATASDEAGEIRATLALNGPFAVIEITDTGPGFPVTDRRRLLEPYMTTRAKGTGLGLAIVARVLEEHRGTLELADRRDGARGACVRLTLPLVPSHPFDIDAPPRATHPETTHAS